MLKSFGFKAALLPTQRVYEINHKDGAEGKVAFSDTSGAMATHFRGTQRVVGEI